MGRLESFCCHMEQTYPRLDVIINNAAQTVRRPPAYYAHLLEAERIDFTAPEEFDHDSVDPTDKGRSSITMMKEVLRGQLQFNESLCGGAGRSIQDTQRREGTSSSDQTAMILPKDPSEIMSSAQMTQLALIPGEEKDATMMFPEALTDVNGQQIDLRKQNSWTMRLSEVPTVEIAEVISFDVTPIYYCEMFFVGVDDA